MSNMEKNVARDDFADLYRNIRGQFSKSKLHKVELRHLAMGRRGDGAGGDQVVQSWAKEHFEDLSPEKFADEIRDLILEDTKIFPGDTIQRYGLFFWQKDTGSHNHRLLIQMRGGGSTEGGDVLGSEAPSNEGRMSQIMRHDEAFIRLNLFNTQKVLDSKDRQIEQQMSMIDKLMNQFVPVLDAVQKLTTRTAEMDFKLERSRKMWEMFDQLGEKAGDIAPVVLATMLKDKKPELAQMIVKASTKPSEQILDLVMADMEAMGPEKSATVFAAIMSLPHGQAILQAMQALASQKKQAQSPPSPPQQPPGKDS